MMKKKVDPKAKPGAQLTPSKQMSEKAKKIATPNLGYSMGESDLGQGHRKLTGSLLNELTSPDLLPGVADPDEGDDTNNPGKGMTSGASNGMRKPPKGK